MSEKFNSILSEVKKIKKPISAYLPTSYKSVELLPLSLNQQKAIIESTVDGAISLLNFNTNLYKIVTQNITETQDITTIDRVNLALTLRQQIQDNLTIDEKTYSLNSVIIKNKELKCPKLTHTVTSSDFVFSLKVPTLESDNKINQFIIKKHKTSDEKMKGFISDLYVGEILKFIENIKVISSDTEITISSTSVSEGFGLLEAIDSSEFTDIIKYITTIREFEKELTKVTNSEQFIDITPDLFVI